jgi:hypothetical protein
MVDIGVKEMFGNANDNSTREDETPSGEDILTTAI